MKPISFVPPVVALALVGGWAVYQKSSIERLEQETVVLRERIEKARQRADSGGDRSLASRMEREKEEKEAAGIDWKEMADAMAESRNGQLPDMRAMMKLQQRIMGMSGEELTAALDEIAALELADDARQALEGMLVGMLAQKDPKLVLERFIGRINDDRSGMGWQLSNAFQQWAGTNPAEATAWFDRQVADGTFDSKTLDGKSQSRLRFEAGLVSSLLATDPAGAAGRVAKLPEDQRLELFQQGMLFNLKPGSEKAYANLVRESVPADQVGPALSQVSGLMVQRGGYERVGGFLDEIDATPEERRAVSGQAVSAKIRQVVREGQLDRESVDEMREWVATQSPDAVDAITGEALGNLWDPRLKFEDTAKLVEDLHAESGSDDLLVSYLQSGQATQHREQALELAKKISDEEKRAEVMRRLGVDAGGAVQATPVR